MTRLDTLVGRTFGPATFVVTPERVVAFVDATRSDPDRWSEHAPPMLANAVLFAVAPRFLEDPEVVAFTRSLIHSEQSFTWWRGLPVGEALTIEAVVASVRSRGPLHLVGFDLTAGSSAGPWLTSSSVFVMADAAATGAGEEPEPPVDEGSVPAAPPGLLPLPEPGESLPWVDRGASRVDLVRYAAATGDWNPIHWDHDSARGAGLSGTIVHGLLMAAWLADAASRHAPGPQPLRELAVRFRSPLRPAAPARAGGTVTSRDPDSALLDLVLESGVGERLVTGRARVTA